MSSVMALLYASWLFNVAIAMPGAMPWMGPMPTPMGLMASAGMSPRPTEAPGSNGVPIELRKRGNVPYPPPPNWCGFVGGFYNDPLTCSNVALTCVNSLDAIGCCTGTTGACTDIYTTCSNYGDACGAACQLDPAIRKCGVLDPYCGTYSFPGGTYLYNCDSTFALPHSMEFLNDYYVSAIGSTLASETTNPFGFIPSITQAAASASNTAPSDVSSTSPFHVSSTSPTTSSSSGGGLSHVAIDGIAAAAAIVGVAILAIIIFFCVRLRKRRRLAAASTPFANTNVQQPPMQQQPQGPPPKAFDGYYSVPQQEQQQPPYTKYPSPPPQQQQQQQQTSYFAPPASASAISPQSTGPSDPRFSTANPTLLSPASETGSQHQTTYKAPTSPTVTEVDGTMGNPGIPTNSPHGTPMEVDGTMGNPGVPHGGHGVANQMQPGGSPNAQEIDGRMGASMTKPFSTDGPYEMGHEAR